MSHYGDSYRPNADLYRPGNSRNGRNYPGRQDLYSQNRNSQYLRSDSSSTYRPSYSGRLNGQNQGRNPQRPTKNVYHQVYAQTQSESQLWQGDLDPSWTEQNIMDIWVQMGENPVSVKIMRDKTGRPQYCFVTFPTQLAVTSAIQKNRMQVPGTSKTFNLNWASGSDSRNLSSRFGGGSGPKTGPEFSVFVGDLDHEVTESALFTRFSREYPDAVKQVKIMVDPTTGESKGFGFVRFFSEDAQKRALKEMNGVLVGDRPIKVGLATGGNQDASGGLKKAKEAAAPSVTLVQKHPALTPFTDPHNSMISIGGITTAITRSELEAHFVEFGNIVLCSVNYRKHVAHIKFLLRSSAQQALVFMHGFIINGCRLTLRWARENVVENGKTRFAAAEKGGKYSGAQKAPAVYGRLPFNVVFEDLSREEARNLKFVEEHTSSVQQTDDEMVARKQDRDRYLALAF